MEPPADRGERPGRFPVMVDLRGRECLVVGGGAVAERKIAALTGAGGRVVVISPTLTAVAERDPSVNWRRRRYRSSEAADQRWAFVIAATDDPTVNAEVVADAATVGVWANDASARDGGPAALPAAHRVGPVTVTVSTGGRVPGAASWLRDLLVAEITPEHLRLIDIMTELRAGHAGISLRSAWQLVTDSGMLELIREGREAEAKERLEACLSSSSD